MMMISVFDLINVGGQCCRKYKEQLKCLICMCKHIKCPNKDAKKIQKTEYWSMCLKKIQAPCFMEDRNMWKALM